MPAELNIANLGDTEQLIESLGIVEKVYSNNCEDGLAVDEDGYEARVVFSWPTLHFHHNLRS